MVVILSRVGFEYELHIRSVFFSTCRNACPGRAVACVQWDDEVRVCVRTLWIADLLTTMQRIETTLTEKEVDQ